VSHKLLSTRGLVLLWNDPIRVLVLFLRPVIPWKCGLVGSCEDSVLSRVLVVLISCVFVCVCVGGGGFVLRLLSLFSHWTVV
jgi:hypothetical protein